MVVEWIHDAKGSVLKNKQVVSLTVGNMHCNLLTRLVSLIWFWDSGNDGGGWFAAFGLRAICNRPADSLGQEIQVGSAWSTLNPYAPLTKTLTFIVSSGSNKQVMALYIAERPSKRSNRLHLTN